MRARLRHLAGDDSGFTLIELLVALAIGSIVLTAVMYVFLTGLTGAGHVTDRVDAAQRARVTADRISMLLGSQVCGPDGDAPIEDASQNSVTFYANLGTVNAAPVRYRLRWDSSTKNIYEDRWVPTGTVAAPVYSASPTRTAPIGVQMVPEDGATLFRYYGFDTVNGGISSTALSAPVNTGLVIAVAYGMTAMPERTKTADPRSTSVEGQAVTGTADPADPNEGNKC
jgi:prepilin-type N-terminal cleavage/methylation domain-containing protein